MCDVKEEEVGIKSPVGPPKKGCKAQRKKLIGDALWIGKRGKGPCKERVIYIFGDAVVFGMEILAGKNRELRCVLHCCVIR
jgi:hypothetical protein